MRPQVSKALAILGGVATLALGSTFMLRLSAPKVREQLSPCAPRLLELERAVCDSPLVVARSADLAQHP
ncbi:MAG TPA: hypothetical protein VJN18_13765 [Polyangiaceae bacterium]|nr:hypothetical protein [Polyangiaceae bacterium]